MSNFFAGVAHGRAAIAEITTLEQIFALEYEEDNGEDVHYNCESCLRFPCSTPDGYPGEDIFDDIEGVEPITCAECDLMDKLSKHEPIVCRKCGEAPW